MKKNNKHKICVMLSRLCSASHPLSWEQRDPEQRHLRMTRGGVSASAVAGFTLIELLVVVLIIGVLTALALPMYQGAVDKSHWSTMLAPTRAIKNAEEAIKLTNGSYTSDMNDLDVSVENGEVQYELIVPDSLSQPNLIRATNSKLPGVRLASYLDDSPMFAGQLHCEANNDRAKRLCEKLLQGLELNATDDNYTRYLLNQDIDKATCDDASRVWSNKQTHCYKTEGDRCTANGMPYSNGFCGYKGSSGTDEDHKLLIEEGATCQGGYTTECQYLQVNAGGACVGYAPNTSFSPCSNNQFNSGSSCTSTQYKGCNDSTFDGATCTGHGAGSCTNGEFHNNSICNANRIYACTGLFDSGSVCIAGDRGTCISGTFKEGSKCIANAVDSCGSNSWFGTVTYEGGCCEGQYCPSNAPKCQD